MSLESENHLHFHLLASQLFSNQGQVSESFGSDGFFTAFNKNIYNKTSLSPLLCNALWILDWYIQGSSEHSLLYIPTLVKTMFIRLIHRYLTQSGSDAVWWPWMRTGLFCIVTIYLGKHFVPHHTCSSSMSPYLHVVLRIGCERFECFLAPGEDKKGNETGLSNTELNLLGLFKLL